MSQQDSQTVSIRLLDKEYVIACPAGTQSELAAAAEYLDEKMRDIRHNGKLVGLERIAVMAALNISHELVRERAAKEQELEDQVQQLSLKIDSVLQRESVSETQNED